MLNHFFSANNILTAHLCSIRFDGSVLRKVECEEIVKFSDNETWWNDQDRPILRLKPSTLPDLAAVLRKQLWAYQIPLHLWLISLMHSFFPIPCLVYRRFSKKTTTFSFLYLSSSISTQLFVANRPRIRQTRTQLSIFAAERRQLELFDSGSGRSNVSGGESQFPRQPMSSTLYQRDACLENEKELKRPCGRLNICS